MTRERMSIWRSLVSFFLSLVISISFCLSLSLFIYLVSRSLSFFLFIFLYLSIYICLHSPLNEGVWCCSALALCVFEPCGLRTCPQRRWPEDPTTWTCPSSAANSSQRYLRRSGQLDYSTHSSNFVFSRLMYC